MPDHLRYRFSVTIHTDDLAIAGCLRALAKFSQKQGNKNIPWGGTNDKVWKRDGQSRCRKRPWLHRFPSPQWCASPHSQRSALSGRAVMSVPLPSECCAVPCWVRSKPGRLNEAMCGARSLAPRRRVASRGSLNVVAIGQRRLNPEPRHVAMIFGRSENNGCGRSGLGV